MSEQRHIAVRQGRNRIVLFEAGETGDRIRPGCEPMPHAIEFVGVGFGQASDMEFAQQIVEDESVQGIDFIHGSSPDRTRCIAG